MPSVPGAGSARQIRGPRHRSHALALQPLGLEALAMNARSPRHESPTRIVGGSRLTRGEGHRAADRFGRQLVAGAAFSLVERPPTARGYPAVDVTTYCPCVATSSADAVLTCVRQGRVDRVVLEARLTGVADEGVDRQHHFDGGAERGCGAQLVPERSLEHASSRGARFHEPVGEHQHRLARFQAETSGRHCRPGPYAENRASRHADHM